MKVQLLLLLGLCSLALSIQVWPNGFIVENEVKNAFGPSFISGKLGHLASLHEHEVRSYFEEKMGDAFLLNDQVEFVFVGKNVDNFGMAHFRYNQKINKLHVQHSQLIVHVNPDKNNEVFAISSAIVPGWKLPVDPALNLEEAIHSITGVIPSHNFRFIGNVELLYLQYNDDVKLAYKADVVYNIDTEEEMRSYFYIDAIENILIVELQRYANAKNRNIYTANNLRVLPGTLVRTEGSAPSTDSTVNDAYTNTGICYDYYYYTFGRNSYNNAGATMVSTVHYGNDYNNAFWNGDQMVFGDGDGTTFSDFAADLTVVCHELTHAVVEYTANLIYQNEPGALNEGFADILGFSAYMYQYGVDTAYQWMIGAECYTPFKAGDALRYMNNPPQDGSSYDFYPGYTGILDNGGVHWNSGIANLAYVLAVQGGTHPQQKSSIYVEPIGVSDAEQIFYTVLANYLTATSQFANARASTVTAARNAYGVGSKQAQTADNCWAAVGVPSTTV